MWVEPALGLPAARVRLGSLNSPLCEIHGSEAQASQFHRVDLNFWIPQMELRKPAKRSKIEPCPDVLFEPLSNVRPLLFFSSPPPSLSQPASLFPRQGTHVPANQQPHHPHPAHRESVPDGTNVQGPRLGSWGLQRKGARALIRFLVAIRSGLFPGCRSSTR